MDTQLTLPVLAGSVSTVIFAGSMLPMVLKAARTKDLASYSLGNLALANVGNAIHSVYVFSLPPGPIWALHSFYVVTTLLMLSWYLRHVPRRRRSPAQPESHRGQGGGGQGVTGVLEPAEPRRARRTVPLGLPPLAEGDDLLVAAADVLPPHQRLPERLAAEQQAPRPVLTAP
ncbi:hypothetical protein [Ornithinicoccus halotolerans]|uniref:hypothetical protein n=1 Tax=Ornithinicoccus halotolerans TaxID=1748220 RepID=UPI001885CB66